MLQLNRRWILSRPQKPDYAKNCANQIRKWLQVCTERHSDRCRRPASDIIPKRLIYFDKARNIERLVAVEHLPGSCKPLDYLALSYCWGREENFRTVEATLQDMEHQVPHDQLPQTLKDVFRMVRLLDFQYLWIDALCIVQDSEEWEGEAAKMGDVYANAALVITAMSSPSVHSGLYSAKREDFSVEERAEAHRIMRTCRTMTQNEWENQLRDTYPLLCRGWAFQERLLARRIVHFAVMELSWECTQDRWCECGDEDRNGSQSGKVNNMNSALKDSRLSAQDGDLTRARLMWHECVKSFTRRDLTKREDRLFAIQGIASYLRGPDPSAYNNQYFYGLWKDFLPWDLLWYCDQTSQLQGQKPRGPSFSWSSVDCGVEWPACDHLHPSKKFSVAISTGTCFDNYSMVEWENGKKYVGASLEIDVTKLQLKMEARVIPVNIKHQDSPSDHTLVIEAIHSGASRVIPFWPDIQLEPNASVDDVVYYFAEIAAFEHGPIASQVGLVVRKKDTGDNRGAYERVGLAFSCGAKGNTTICEGRERHQIALT